MTRDMFVFVFWNPEESDYIWISKSGWMTLWYVCFLFFEIQKRVTPYGFASSDFTPPVFMSSMAWGSTKAQTLYFFCTVNVHPFTISIPILLPVSAHVFLEIHFRTSNFNRDLPILRCVFCFLMGRVSCFRFLMRCVSCFQRTDGSPNWMGRGSLAYIHGGFQEIV